LFRKGDIVMGLFGLGKKKEEKETASSCCPGEECTPEAVEKATNNLDTGEDQLGMDTAIEHVTDFNVIAAYGVMTTPALVVDGKVVSYGKVLKVEEATKLLQKVRA
jgi:hypothetical protein